MFRKIVLIVLIFVLIFAFCYSVNGITIYVDDEGKGEYNHIQSAIDNSTSGDTIYVYSGCYYESIILNKSIELVGEDKNTTFIEREIVTDDIIKITADNVSISGFTITTEVSDQNKSIYDFVKTGTEIIILINQTNRATNDIRDYNILKEMDSVYRILYESPKNMGKENYIEYVYCLSKYIRNENSKPKPIGKGQDEVPNDLDSIYLYMERESITNLYDILYSSDFQKSVLFIKMQNDADFSEITKDVNNAIENRGTNYANMEIKSATDIHPDDNSLSVFSCGIFAKSNNSKIFGNNINRNTWGIFLDENVKGNNISDNLVFNSAIGIYSKSNSNNNIYDNTFVDNKLNTKFPSENEEPKNGTPGFELVVMLISIVFFYFLKLKRSSI